MKNPEGSDPDQSFREFMKNHLEADVPSQITSKAQKHLASFRSEHSRESFKPEGLGQTDKPTPPFTRTKWHWSLWIGVPAAAIVILAIVFSANLPHGTAYGQAVETLRTARTLSMRIISFENAPNLSLENPEAFPRTPEAIKAAGGLVSSFVYKDPGLFRSEYTQEGETFVTVFDYAAERGLRTQLNAKEFTELNLNLMPQQSQLGDPIEKFRNLPPLPEKTVGERSLNGQKVVGYQVQWEGQSAVLWIDPKTKELVEIHSKFDGFNSVTLHSDFKFDNPIDDSVFSLIPPAGFAKKLNALETIQQRIDKLREKVSNEIPAVSLAPLAITLWMANRKEDAIAILIDSTSIQPESVEVLQSFRTKESDLPRLSPEELQPLQSEFIQVARATKEMCRAFRVQISEEESEGRTENVAAWRKIHQGIGRELMKRNYVAMINMVGEAIYKYKLE